jgi:hypothetical protein
MNYLIIGLGVIIGLVILLKIVRFIKDKRDERYFEEDIAWQVSRARQMGISLNNVKFDQNGSLINNSTGEPITY